MEQVHGIEKSCAEGLGRRVKGTHEKHGRLDGLPYGRTAASNGVSVKNQAE